MHIVFDKDTGLLIPGEYKLSIKEFEKEFVTNEERRIIFKGFQKLIKIFTAIECEYLYADGSFVTKKPFPSDIDVCWHMHNESSKRDQQLEALLKICPPLFFLNKIENREYIQKEFCADVFPANTKERDSGLLFKDFFQKDKHTDEPKGIIVIDLL
ncbi:DUF6932 family protein [Pedobacter arcticus]|uniref:DUF6932 family protein n=1 Tax=Pedobacter arcticus TaxID=752140 RepID=UPI000366B3CC|nr:hypothetical protein [Pedobacter arcticus]